MIGVLWPITAWVCRVAPHPSRIGMLQSQM